MPDAIEFDWYDFYPPLRFSLICSQIAKIGVADWDLNLPNRDWVAARENYKQYRDLLSSSALISDGTLAEHEYCNIRGSNFFGLMHTDSPEVLIEENPDILEYLCWIQWNHADFRKNSPFTIPLLGVFTKHTAEPNPNFNLKRYVDRQEGLAWFFPFVIWTPADDIAWWSVSDSFATWHVGQGLLAALLDDVMCGTGSLSTRTIPRAIREKWKPKICDSLSNALKIEFHAKWLS